MTNQTVETTKSTTRVSLEKKIESTPEILSLAKKAKISLAKVNFSDHKAKVALCLDISQSMSTLYSSGKIQELINRVLALGCQFDDDGQIDVFLFGEKAHQAGEVGLDNFHNFASDILKIHPLEGATNYGKVIKIITDFYFPSTVAQDGLPVYVMFVTDGDANDKADAEKQLIAASYEPIFWQFMAIGGGTRYSSFGFDFLEKLDNLNGRYIDNANFFSVEDPAKVGETEMYDLLMSEYPGWIKLVNAKNLLSKTRVKPNTSSSRKKTIIKRLIFAVICSFAAVYVAINYESVSVTDKPSEIQRY